MAFEFEPTSLKRGEGLRAGLLRAVRGELRWRSQAGGRGGMRGDEQISTMMGLI